MCLIIKKIRKPKVNKEGFCTAWKVVTEYNKSPFNCIIGEKMLHTYKTGENIDKNYNGIDVNCGFHLFLKKRDAKELLEELEDDVDVVSAHKIIKVFYKPEDALAYGEATVMHLLDGGFPNRVTVKKLTIKSLDAQ